MIKNKKIFIFGGSGSLGNQLIKRYIDNNIIVCYSRDECKHWKMELEYKNKNLHFTIGDIRNKDRVENSLIRENPNLIIIASALKHIDKCEYAVDECMQTNFNGVANVLNTIENNKQILSNLEAVCFISTDKACSPVNVYGMSKALAEKLVIEKSLFIKDIKFVCVRYGNVLNSRGSIIQILHEKGINDKEFTLTHSDMTRFVMTLDQSVDLIEHAIINGESGDIIIPNLISMNVIDLFKIFSEKYNKSIKITELRTGEKMLESLINETQAMSMEKDDKYYYIKPPYKNICNIKNSIDYNSKMNPLSKEELKNYLNDLKLL